MMNINDWVMLYKSTPNALLVDVRPSEEFELGCIPEAVNIPASMLHAMPVHFPYFNTPLFVYCTIGLLADKSARTLSDLGYTNVQSIGGIMDFNGALEYPVDQSTNRFTKRGAGRSPQMSAAS